VDSSVPSGVGALGRPDAILQQKHSTCTRPALVGGCNWLSYYTRQIVRRLLRRIPYRRWLHLGGATPTTCTGFTTMVFEPYENPEWGRQVAW
jgi:hypothetical protein